MLDLNPSGSWLHFIKKPATVNLLVIAQTIYWVVLKNREWWLGGDGQHRKCHWQALCHIQMSLEATTGRWQPWLLLLVLCVVDYILWGIFYVSVFLYFLDCLLSPVFFGVWTYSYEAMISGFPGQAGTYHMMLNFHRINEIFGKHRVGGNF